MGFNIFVGTRRVALLVGALVVVQTLLSLTRYQPYVSLRYSIDDPHSEFVRTDESCPVDGATDYFASRTTAGHEVDIELCLLPARFKPNGAWLVPYAIDANGTRQGSPTYSRQVAFYKVALQKRFKLPRAEDAAIDKQVAGEYRAHWIAGLQYLLIGLCLYGAAIAAIGRMVRESLHIPRGMDARPALNVLDESGSPP